MFERKNMRADASDRHFGIIMRDANQVTEVRDKITKKYKIELIPPFGCDFCDPWGNRIQCWGPARSAPRLFQPGLLITGHHLIHHRGREGVGLQLRPGCRLGTGYGHARWPDVLLPPDVIGNARTGSGKPFFAFQVSLTHPGCSASGTLGL